MLWIATGWKRVVTTLGGQRVLEALGGLYVGLAFWWLLAIGAGRSVPASALIVFVLIAGPGIVLAWGGHWLPRFDVRADLHPTVVGWCLGGLVLMLGVLGFYSLQPGEVVDEPSSILILTGLSSVAGLAAGIHNAQARTRARELEETVEHLRTSNERLEQFAYAASHDLQEPLRMVSSYLQLLDQQYADELDEDAREYIDFAVGGADRMRAMVESLLEYSRITSRGGTFEPTDSGDVFQGVLDDLQLRIEETDATITCDDLPTIPADADQLSRVFQNLLSNAIAFSGDEPPRIHVSAERNNGEWRFSVADEGIGIDPEYHERIFTVFEQLHAADMESEPGGGGLGLALCERIVERHGGEMWVESEPGEGSTFYFTIPTTTEQGQERPAQSVFSE